MLLETLKKLENVQELDLQISLINRKKAEFPERLSPIDREISAATQSLQEKQKVLDELEKNLRQQNGALELNEERTKRSEVKLEQIKTNQEYQSLQKEIETLKKNSAVIKENAEKLRAEVEKHRQELAQIEASINELKTKHDAESQKISGEEKNLDSELKDLLQARSQAVVGIEPRLLNAYEKIRNAKFGIGIVRAVAGSCKGCNMKLPPQIYNELQRGTEMHSCPSCRRILVYSESRETSASEAFASTN